MAPGISLDSIGFDTSRYEDCGGNEKNWTWMTPEGDGVGQYFFALPPDLPRNLKTAEELREDYRVGYGNDQIKIVEFDLPWVAGVRCVWIIIKIPQQPSGMTYLGSLTLPFTEFSYVIKMQCNERGITGMRDTALFVVAQQRGEITFTDDGKIVGAWNADDPIHDDKFPAHPVSRLRREFARIKATLRVNDEVKAAKPFPLPEQSKA